MVYIAMWKSTYFSQEKKVPYAELQKAIFPLEIHIELTKRKNKYL